MYLPLHCCIFRTINILLIYYHICGTNPRPGGPCQLRSLRKKVTGCSVEIVGVSVFKKKNGVSYFLRGSISNESLLKEKLLGRGQSNC